MDDDRGFNRSTCELLKSRGHETFSAYDGKEAFEILEREDLDLVILDIKLPDSSGVDLLEQVKDRYSDIVCIMVTGHSSTETAVDSLNLRAEGYLTKPIDPVDLFETVEKARRRRARRLYEERVEALHRHATALAKAGSIEEIAEITLEVLLKVFGFPQQSFYVVQEDCVKELMSQPSGAQDEMSLEGKGVVVRTVNTGETQLVSDVRQDPDYVPPSKNDGLGTLSELAVPVKIENDEVVAVINVESPKLESFTGQDLELVEILATHVSSAISRLNRMTLLEKAVRRRTHELRKAYKQLKELDNMKDQFMSMAAHELRTPLVSIKGYIDYIQGGSAGEIPDRITELLDIVQRNTERLESLTDDLLDQQRIESGKMEINTEPSDLGEIINDVIEETCPLMEKKNQNLRSDIPPELPRLPIDKTRISQVLINLLSNASKFSPEGSEIKLNIEVGDRFVKVSVEDEGIGLSEEDIDKLFEPFPEIDRPTVTEKSTGLGLSICQGIIKLHDGRIWAESEGRGKGSTFTFTIPKQSQKE